MPERMTWDEMVEKYPDKWVVLTDVTFEDECRANVESAVVVQVLSDDEEPIVHLRNDRKGINYLYRRTTEYLGFIGGLL